MNNERLAKAQKLAEELVDSSLVPLIAAVLKKRARQFTEAAAEIMCEELKSDASVRNDILRECRDCVASAAAKISGNIEPYGKEYLEDLVRRADAAIASHPEQP